MQTFGNISVLDFIGTVVLATVILVDYSSFINELQLKRAHKSRIAIVIAIWLGFVVAMTASGQATASIIRPFPTTVIPMLASFATLVFIMPIVVGLIALVSPSVRAALLAIPMQLLIGVHAFRILGILFFILHFENQVDGPWAFFAGGGDIITAILVPPVLALAARPSPQDWMIHVWNAFGMLDFVAAITLGLISTPEVFVQLIPAAKGAAGMTRLPWELVPTVIVPFYMITHGIIFAQLQARRRHVAKVPPVSRPA